MLPHVTVGTAVCCGLAPPPAPQATFQRAQLFCCPAGAPGGLAPASLPPPSRSPPAPPGLWCNGRC